MFEQATLNNLTFSGEDGLQAWTAIYYFKGFLAITEYKENID